MNQSDYFVSRVATSTLKKLYIDFFKLKKMCKLLLNNHECSVLLINDISKSIRYKFWVMNVQY